MPIDGCSEEIFFLFTSVHLLSSPKSLVSSLPTSRQRASASDTVTHTRPQSPSLPVPVDKAGQPQPQFSYARDPHAARTGVTQTTRACVLLRPADLMSSPSPVPVHLRTAPAATRQRNLARRMEDGRQRLIDDDDDPEVGYSRCIFGCTVVEFQSRVE